MPNEQGERSGVEAIYGAVVIASTVVFAGIVIGAATGLGVLAFRLIAGGSA